MRKPTHQKAQKIILRHVIALTTIVATLIFFVQDLIVDIIWEGEIYTLHFFIELFVFCAVSWVLVIGVRDFRRLLVRLERERWRNKKLAGTLLASIDKQLEEWQLTRSEKEIAWYLIKGFRFTEIAQARGVKEKTVRLQASMLYAKVNVNGRAELVAEIIQPLLDFSN